MIYSVLPAHKKTNFGVFPTEKQLGRQKLWPALDGTSTNGALPGTIPASYLQFVALDIKGGANYIVYDRPPYFRVVYWFSITLLTVTAITPEHPHNSSSQLAPPEAQ